MTVASSPEDRNRAGRYVRQPAGYRAFIPAPLPPAPPIRMSGVLEDVRGRRRNRAFLYRDYVRIFADDTDLLPDAAAPG